MLGSHGDGIDAGGRHDPLVEIMHIFMKISHRENLTENLVDNVRKFRESFPTQVPYGLDAKQ